MDELNIIIDALFLGVFLTAVLRYVRRPDRINRDVLAVFGSFAGLFASSALLAIWPDVPRIARVVPIVLLFAEPWLTLRLARDFRPQPRWLPVAAAVGMLGSIVLIVSVNIASGVGLYAVVAYFVGVNVIAANYLRQAAGQRVGIARARLTLSAASTLAIAAAVLILGLSTLLDPGVRGALSTAARLVALGAALGYVLSFMPPGRWLLLVQRSIAFDRMVAVTKPHPGEDGPWRALGEASRAITGCRSVLVAIDRGGPDIVATVGEPVAADALLAAISVIQSIKPGRGLLASKWTPSDTATLAALRADDVRVLTLAELPTVPRWWLVLLFDGSQLFIEDDLALVTLVAEQARHSLELDRALEERTKLQVELRESRLRAQEARGFRALLDAQPNALLAVDQEGRIAYLNERAARMFGYEQVAFLGTDVAVVLPDRDDAADPDRRAHFWERSGDRQARSGIELVAQRGDGTVFTAEVSLSPYVYESRDVMLVAIVDISERKREAELRDRFLDVLSHELRTPVTTIYGGAQLLRRGSSVPEDDRATLLDDIAQEADRLQRIVEDLITLARVERGALTGGADPVRLQGIVPRLVERERRRWPAARYEVSIPRALSTVSGDEDSIGQIMRNLLSNAAKYGASDDPITIRAVEGAGLVTITVEDRGPGFPDSEAEALFELYHRSPTTSRLADGAGVGLFVARRMAEAMGGRIWGSARAGGGAVFGLELPIYEHDELADSVTSRSGTHRPALAGVPTP